MRTLPVVTVVIALVAALPAIAGQQALITRPRTIKGLGYETMSFEVPGAWMHRPRVAGHIEVTGGGKKDLDVLVLRDSSLTAWEKHRDVDTLFAARHATTVTLDVALPAPDHYVIVLSNRFSKLASKQVTADVRLEWDDDSMRVAVPPRDTMMAAPGISR